MNAVCMLKAELLEALKERFPQAHIGLWDPYNLTVSVQITFNEGKLNCFGRLIEFNSCFYFQDDRVVCIIEEFIPFKEIEAYRCWCTFEWLYCDPQFGIEFVSDRIDQIVKQNEAARFTSL
jgi:hypothetical protein